MKAMLIAAVFAVSVQATDSATFRYLGADASGSHAAWMMYGVQDGSGFPWAVVEILSTIPHRVLERHSVLITSEDTHRNHGPDSALALAAASLEDMGISIEHGGLVLLEHKLTDAGVSPDTVVFATEIHYTWYPGITYTMVLEQVPSGIENLDAPWFPEPVLIRLTISDGRSRALLFRENTAPDPYMLCFAYRISRVIKLDERTLLVVFNAMIPGFEGPDLRYRVLAVEFPIAWRR